LRTDISELRGPKGGPKPCTRDRARVSIVEEDSFAQMRWRVLQGRRGGGLSAIKGEGEGVGGGWRVRVECEGYRVRVGWRVRVIG
jgi:hypothetical protein